MTYRYKTKPRRHQRDAFEVFKDDLGFNLFWDPGVGKTKPTLDNIAYLYLQGKITGAVIVAPNGVQRNWCNVELPKHMPDDVLAQTGTFIWESKKVKQVGVTADREELLRHKGLAMIFLSFPAVITDTAEKYLRRFMTRRVCLLVGDELQAIKTGGAATTHRVLAMSRWAPKGKQTYRRGLTGTPITKSPVDVYSQMVFADPNFWKDRNLHPKKVFEARYVDILRRQDALRKYGWDPQRDIVQGFKRLDELKCYLKAKSHRLTKKSAGVELPDKIFTRQYFKLRPKVREFYNKLRSSHSAQLPDSGEWVHCELAIAALTRCQQVVCGYVATEADEPVQMIEPGHNPRLQALLEKLEELPGKGLIWARFTQDINLIVAALQERGCSVARYDGSVSDDDRERSIADFQDGDLRYLVLQYQAAHSGLTLTRAEHVHNYCLTYDYVHATQSLNRVHRIGLDHAVLIVDYIAENTIDEEVVDNLRTKQETATAVLGE